MNKKDKSTISKNVDIKEIKLSFYGFNNNTLREIANAIPEPYISCLLEKKEKAQIISRLLYELVSLSDFKK